MEEGQLKVSHGYTVNSRLPGLCETLSQKEKKNKARLGDLGPSVCV